MKLKSQPLSHQAKCLALHGNAPAFALTAEMGTGKTWIAMINAAHLYLSKRCDALLVFAPNGVHTNWTRRELPKHMPEDVSYVAAAWGGNKEEQKTFARLLKPMNDLRIITMNWEALGTKRGFEAVIKFCEASQYLAIVCDESDWVKNPKAGRTKALMKLRGYSRWRRIMTGTPFDGTPFSAFSQYNFLDPKILNCSNYAAFKSEYAHMLRRGHPLLERIMEKNKLRFTPQLIERDVDGRPKYRNLDKLAALIGPHTFRVLKKDCLDLPEKIYKTLLFTMTPTQRAVYRKAEKECRLEFEGDETPFAKLAIANKLSQITSGYYLHPFAKGEPVRIEGGNPKMDLLRERITAIVEAGEQVIVWARYKVQITDIAAMVGEIGLGEHGDIPVPYVTYYGETDLRSRAHAIDEFESGRAKVFIGNQQAGGSGITLVAASYVIYFSNNFSLRDRLQSEDRAHRIGQTKNVTYINIVAEGTVDEQVVDALMNKQEVSEMIQSGAIRVLS